MGRPPIGKRAMTAAERKRRQRERYRRQTPPRMELRVEDCLEAFCGALWDYAQCLAEHRKRFKTDDQFQAWLTENEYNDVDPEEVTALLAMAKIGYLYWRDAINLHSLISPVRPAALYEAVVAEARRWSPDKQTVTRPVTNGEDGPEHIVTSPVTDNEDEPEHIVTGSVT